MRAKGYADLASAIGDLDWQTVPEDDPEDPNLHHDWQNILQAACEHVDGWLYELSPHPLGYNLDSIGFPASLSHPRDTSLVGWMFLFTKVIGVNVCLEGQRCDSRIDSLGLLGPHQVEITHRDHALEIGDIADKSSQLVKCPRGLNLDR